MCSYPTFLIHLHSRVSLVSYTCARKCFLHNSKNGTHLPMLDVYNKNQSYLRVCKNLIFRSLPVYVGCYLGCTEWPSCELYPWTQRCIAKLFAFNRQTAEVREPILASAGDFTIRLSDPRPDQKTYLMHLSPHAPGKEVGISLPMAPSLHLVVVMVWWYSQHC